MFELNTCNTNLSVQYYVTTTNTFLDKNRCIWLGVYFSLNLALTCAMNSNYLGLNGETGLEHTSLNQTVRHSLFIIPDCLNNMMIYVLFV